jgi:hypothetical protein
MPIAGTEREAVCAVVAAWVLAPHTSLATTMARLRHSACDVFTQPGVPQVCKPGIPESLLMPPACTPMTV